ncbi:MAG: PAS domain S-box protein [Alphaproteobacteria bacterium]|nr:PAS domain S-box protein [Alphaproteobacteria bacterium]
MALDQASFSTNRLARGARLVIAALLLLTVVAGGFAFLIGDHFNKIERDWLKFSSIPTEKGLLLSRLNNKIGFSGLIHNFKNYVIRGDVGFRNMALSDHADATDILDQYALLGVSGEEHAAIQAIRRVIDEYRDNIAIVENMHAAGNSTAEIDRRIRVRDTEMIHGLTTLRTAWRNSYDSGRAILSSSVDEGRMWSLGAQIAAALFLGLAIAMAVWILHRERLLGDAVRRLEAHADRFESIVNNSSDGMLTVTLDGRIESFNTAAEQIFGYSSQEAVGMEVSALVPDDLQDGHRETIREIASSNTETIHYPRLVHGRRKDGSSVPIEINIAAYQVEGTKNYVASFRDITTRLRAEIELRDLKEAAEAASDAKSSFLASMSHELRTPLNAVIGFSEMLRMGDLSERQLEWTAHIHTAGTHLHELVGQILDLAQIERGRLDIRPRPVDVVEIMMDCLAQMQPAADKQKVELTSSLPDRRKVCVYADPTRLRQCVFNILSNAVKYNREHGSVVVSGKDTQDGFYRISVTDTGIGIAAEDHPYVFRMFQRFAEEPELAREGAGIGLAVTDQLVRLMGGRLTFISEKGKGSEFRIDIPKSEPLRHEAVSAALNARATLAVGRAREPATRRP